MNKQVEPAEPVEPDTWPKTHAEVSALFGGKTGHELYAAVAAALRYMGNPSWVTRCAAVVLECNPPAQTPVPHGWWIVQSAPEKLNMWPTSEGQLLRIAAPPAQTPPPRLTDDDLTCVFNEWVSGKCDGYTFSDAVQDAVRKQFGVNDE